MTDAEPFIPPPPPITTPEQRRRWALCLSIATTCSECCEESGVADPMFVAITAPMLYWSDLPTDDETLACEGCARPASANGPDSGRRPPP